ncbi:MAG: SRPBCC family protein [Promethearchaeota archaeon]|nr:MAG: SRPBCC family protein [Candidatus Lokiarchaeota archaeon]
MRFHISVNTNQPIEIVWEAFIKPENMLHWTKYLEKVEVVKGKLGEIGAVSRLHYLEKGKPYILEDKLVSYEEGKKIGSQVSGQRMLINVETFFESLNGGTKISMDWDGTSDSFIMSFIFKLMRRKMIKQAESELHHFKSLVEKYGETFPNKPP